MRYTNRLLLQTHTNHRVGTG